jgi:hypothetical protein
MRFLSFVLTICLAQPCLAQEREWSWDTTDEDAFLVFGAPNTDDVGFSFWCKIGSAKIKIYAANPHNRPFVPAGTLTIAANGKDFLLPYKKSSDGPAEQNAVEVELDASHAIFDTLRSADFMTLRLSGHTSAFPLMDADLELLMKTCGKR